MVFWQNTNTSIIDELRSNTHIWSKILSKSLRLWVKWKYLFKIDNSSISCDYIISMHLTANRRKIQTTSQYIYHDPFQRIFNIIVRLQGKKYKFIINDDAFLVSFNPMTVLASNTNNCFDFSHPYCKPAERNDTS